MTQGEVTRCPAIVEPKQNLWRFGQRGRFPGAGDAGVIRIGRDGLIARSIPINMPGLSPRTYTQFSNRN
jgi:hypothetical protein